MSSCEITGSAKSMAGHGSKIKTNCFDQVCRVAAFWVIFQLIGWQHGHTSKKALPCTFQSQSTSEKRCVFSFAFLLWSFFAELGRTLRSPELILCFAQVVMVTITKKKRIWRIHILDETNQRGENHCLNAPFICPTCSGQPTNHYEHKPQDFEHSWPQSQGWSVGPTDHPTPTANHSKISIDSLSRCIVWLFLLTDDMMLMDQISKFMLKLFVANCWAGFLSVFRHLQDQFHPPFCRLCAPKKPTAKVPIGEFKNTNGPHQPLASSVNRCHGATPRWIL